MSSKYTTASSRPHDCVLPRSDRGYKPHRDGPLQPMEEDESALARFSRRFAYFAMGFAGAIGVYHVARAIGAANLWFVL